MIFPEWHTPWLLLIALQPVLIIIFRRLFQRNHLNRYVKKELQAWVAVPQRLDHRSYSLIRNILYCLAWIAFAIAAAGPRIAEDIPNGANYSGKDIMVVLDISQSMQASDITPNRLRQAHAKINYLIKESPNTRIGIIVYAAKPHLYVPVTYDKAALQFYLRNIELLTPPSQGSRPSLAIKLAGKQLSSQHREKYILHITDADTDKKETSELKDSLNAIKNIPIYTLLIASEKGEAVPAFKDGWLNIDGNPVVSRPNISGHKEISNMSNGYFTISSTNNTGIETLIDKIRNDDQLSNTNNISTSQNWHELFPSFLFMGIILLLLSMLPYKPKLTSPLKSPAPTLLIVFVLLGSLTSEPVSANEQDTLQKAYTALKTEDYLKARQLYSSVNNYAGHYGEAVAAYRMEDYPRAIRLFEQAVLLATSDTDYAGTLYNVGNCYFQVGNFPSAIASYQAALLYDPEHSASKHNMVFAKKALLAVEERKKLINVTTRAGRGPRSAIAADNITITENTGVSLGESESSGQDIEKTSSSSSLDIPELIILKGLEFAENSASNVVKNTASEKYLSTVATKNQLNKLYDNQPALWQRIFEVEEGYPAPLDEPDNITGVLPW